MPMPTHVITHGQFKGHLAENRRPLDGEGFIGWSRVTLIVTYGTNRDIDVPTGWLATYEAMRDVPTGRKFNVAGLTIKEVY
jgi:hypothetical protein